VCQIAVDRLLKTEYEMAALILGRWHGWVQKMGIGYKHEASESADFWIHVAHAGIMQIKE
jgi:hypothetical protein